MRMTSCLSFGARRLSADTGDIPVEMRWAFITVAVIECPLMLKPFKHTAVFRILFKTCFQSKSGVKASMPHLRSNREGSTE